MGVRENKLRDLLEPVVGAMGCELWGLEFSSQGRLATLRLYIEKAGGVAVEDCEKVSRQVSSVLDVEDPIKGEYTLEVSSPGLDRPLYTLDQFVRYAGEQVSIQLRMPYEGRRRFKGLLKGVEGEEIVVVVDEHEYLFPFEGVEKARVVPRF